MARLAVRRMNEPIVILGVEITEERYPNLYRIGEHNPKGLELQIAGLIMETQNNDVESVARIYEEDLEHERRSGYPETE